jgi:hypothetical protein
LLVLGVNEGGGDVDGFHMSDVGDSKVVHSKVRTGGGPVNCDVFAVGPDLFTVGELEQVATVSVGTDGCPCKLLESSTRTVNKVKQAKVERNTMAGVHTRLMVADFVGLTKIVERHCNNAYGKQFGFAC